MGRPNSGGPYLSKQKKEKERTGILMFVTKTWGLKMNGFSSKERINHTCWLLTKVDGCMHEFYFGLRSLCVSFLPSYSFFLVNVNT